MSVSIYTISKSQELFASCLRQVKQSEKIAKEEAEPMEHKDYSLKEGEKIKIHLNVRLLNYIPSLCD